MGTQRLELTVEPRETGKHFSRSLRQEKKVPAVVYGAGKKNFNICIDERAIVKYHTRAYENALFNLNLDGQQVIALMKHVDVHPLSRRPEHVDFLAIDMNKPIRIMLEIKFDGKPIGLADGGLLNIVNRQIEIEVLPSAIPDALAVDVSGLGVGDSLHVSDLTIPAGVKLMSSVELTLATVAIEKEEAAPVVEAAVAAAPAAGAAAPAAGAKAPAAGAKAEPAKPAAKK